MIKKRTTIEISTKTREILNDDKSLVPHDDPVDRMSLSRASAGDPPGSRGRFVDNAASERTTRCFTFAGAHTYDTTDGPDGIW